MTIYQGTIQNFRTSNDIRQELKKINVLIKKYKGNTNRLANLRKEIDSLRSYFIGGQYYNPTVVSALGHKINIINGKTQGK